MGLFELISLLDILLVLLIIYIGGDLGLKSRLDIDSSAKFALGHRIIVGLRG
jgi:biopolymer transport protein ExbD